MKHRNRRDITVTANSQNPFDTLTSAQREELQRVLGWVLVATQCSEEQRATIALAIALLDDEGPISPVDVGEA